MKRLTVGSCFSGIGGLELGLEWTGGFETKWQIEIDSYATKVLKKRWPDVKRYSDIRNVVRPGYVDLIAGGFPCQDISFAGQRKGLEGKRSTLWFEMFRLVCEVRPEWILAENVPGLLSSDDGRFFGNILRDLAGAGYDAEWRVLSAAGVGAPHLRKRVFIVAHTDSYRRNNEGENKKRTKRTTRRTTFAPSKQRENCQYSLVENTQFNGLEESRYRRISRGATNSVANPSWWAVEPAVGRVAHGIPSRVDRLRCLGNAVVPQVAQKIGEMILRFNDQQKTEGGVG